MPVPETKPPGPQFQDANSRPNLAVPSPNYVRRVVAPPSDSERLANIERRLEQMEKKLDVLLSSKGLTGLVERPSTIPALPAPVAEVPK
jgi:hypothetical protein